MLGEKLTTLLVLGVDLALALALLKWVATVIRYHELPVFPPLAIVGAACLYLMFYLLLLGAASVPPHYNTATSESQSAFSALLHWPVARVVKLLAYGQGGEMKLLRPKYIGLCGVAVYSVAAGVLHYSLAALKAVRRG